MDTNKCLVFVLFTIMINCYHSDVIASSFYEIQKVGENMKRGKNKEKILLFFYNTNLKPLQFFYDKRGKSIEKDMDYCSLSNKKNPPLSIKVEKTLYNKYQEILSQDWTTDSLLDIRTSYRLCIGVWSCNGFSHKYVTLTTPEMSIPVSGEAAVSSGSQATGLRLPERSGVRNLSEDIRFIRTGAVSLSKGTPMLVGRAVYPVLLLIMALGAAGYYLYRLRSARRKADVVGSRKRGATKMALKRLSASKGYLDKNLDGAFYEELHRALLGYISDKFNMPQEDLDKDNIVAKLQERGVSEDLSKQFTDLVDACEFARYSPAAGEGALRAHYDDAVKVIYDDDKSSYKLDDTKTVTIKKDSPPKWKRVFIFLLSDNHHLSVGRQFDNAGGLMGLMLLTACPTYIIHFFKNAWINITIVLRSRFTADISRSRYDGLLETEAEFVRESLLRDANTDRTILGNQIRCQVHSPVKNQRCRFLYTVNKLPGHIGHISHIALQTGIAVNQADKRLGIVALLDFIHTFHGLRVGSITTDSPNGIRRIEDHPTLSHCLNGILNIGCGVFSKSRQSTDHCVQLVPTSLGFRIGTLYLYRLETS